MRLLLVYGFSMFAFQFSFMFLGMKLGVSAGLASLILQFQVFVTLGLAVVFLKETVSFPQIAGALVATAGFVLVGLHTGGEITAAGFACLLLAAVSWAIGNFTSKRLGRVNPLALVVWGSLPVAGAMAVASLVFEGPALIVHSLAHVSLTAILCTAYTVYFSTHVAYSLWSWLLARHPATTITPFALLVPVFGMLSSAVLLGEPLPGWKLAAAALVIAGLSLTIFGAHIAPARPRFGRGPSPAQSSLAGAQKTNLSPVGETDPGVTSFTATDRPRRVIPIARWNYPVSAMNEAAKQSSWIAPARFAPLAMTSG
ncbi:MAG: EamA family transporter [Lacunisphaera sp.]